MSPRRWSLLGLLGSLILTVGPADGTRLFGLEHPGFRHAPCQESSTTRGRVRLVDSIPDRSVKAVAAQPLDAAEGLGPATLKSRLGGGGVAAASRSAAGAEGGADDPEGEWRRLNREIFRLFAEGELDEATQVAELALQVAVETFGPEHPKVATALSNLATLYRVQRKHTEAEGLYKRALTIREKAFGPDHPKVATSLNHLAGMHRVRGRYAEAAALYERSLAIRERALGEGHPMVAESLNNLGVVYKLQGRYIEAESLYKRALGIWEKTLGSNDPNVATVLENMAELYRALGRLDEAMALNHRAERIRTNRGPKR